jgi:hypothetical protein
VDLVDRLLSWPWPLPTISGDHIRRCCPLLARHNPSTIPRASTPLEKSPPQYQKYQLTRPPAKAEPCAAFRRRNLGGPNASGPGEGDTSFALSLMVQLSLRSVASLLSLAGQSQSKRRRSDGQALSSWGALEKRQRFAQRSSRESRQSRSSLSRRESCSDRARIASLAGQAVKRRSLRENSGECRIRR